MFEPVRTFRLALLLSGSGRTLMNLRERILDGRLAAVIHVVVSSRGDVAGVEKARRAGLRTVVVERKGMSAEAFDDAITRAVEGAAWRVKPLNVCEKNVAHELIPEAKPQGLLLADGNYDAGRLYDLAMAGGALLLTPFQENAGGAHRRKSPIRLLAIRAWNAGARNLYRLRTDIERRFSQQSSFGGGLAPLPPWVRGLPRVTQSVGTKLMIYHVRLKLREAAA